ncbi:hypothetical protein B0H19DRAFT_1275581 [Mycena capillaripes]|nr:hypothetical protein B0H19DRAFT_1275581 [Mycena capillaripes]
MTIADRRQAAGSLLSQYLRALASVYRHGLSAMTSLPRLDSLTGAPLIGTWASSLLYMAELLQAVYYFRHFKNDDWKLKTLVIAALSIDTVSMLGDYAGVYLAGYIGDLDYLAKQNWGVPLYIISTSFVAVLVQGFLAIRYWRLTNNTILVAFLFLLIFAAFGGGLSSGLTIALFPALEDRTKVKISGTVWSITEVAADVIIAVALVREFLKAKSRFTGKRRRINNTLNRLVALAIQTGSATAVISTAALVAHVLPSPYEQTNIPTGLMYSLGRTYVLSMLLNLNIRAHDGFTHGNTDIMSSVQFLTTPTQHSRGTGKSSSMMSAIAETAPSEIEMTSHISKP